MPQLTLLTPCGELTISAEEDAIVALDWGRGRDQCATPLLRHARDQLQDWFDGRRRSFDLPLAAAGTAFQQRVWASLLAVPFGETLSYGHLAAQLGTGPRAIGQAVGANPIPILIPCHRVLAARGAIGGYSGHEGVTTKRFLLDHERRLHNAGSAAYPPSFTFPAGSAQ